MVCFRGAGEDSGAGSGWHVALTCAHQPCTAGRSHAVPAPCRRRHALPRCRCRPPAEGLAGCAQACGLCWTSHACTQLSAPAAPRHPRRAAARMPPSCITPQHATQVTSCGHCKLHPYGATALLPVQHIHGSISYCFTHPFLCHAITMELCPLCYACIVMAMSALHSPCTADSVSERCHSRLANKQ